MLKIVESFCIIPVSEINFFVSWDNNKNDNNYIKTKNPHLKEQYTHFLISIFFFRPGANFFLDGGDRS